METEVRVLVVDDDPDVRAFLQDYLSEHDYQVTALDSGAALRRQLEPDPAQPHLIRTVRGVGYMYVPAADPV